jgi:predicted N-formylglutamate amidohydrolase
MPDRSSPFVLLSCEHGGNRVPAYWAPLFQGQEATLATHRGLDLGALDVAIHLACLLARPLFASTTTRLLVELNRSLDHPQLFSDITRSLAPEQQRHIIEDYYTPYRAAVAECIEGAINAQRRAVHLSIHSFTDILDHVPRHLDVGLLFDPARPAEAELALHWKHHIEQRMPGLRVRFNEPYLGTDDGLTTAFRTHCPAHRYIGIEVELRQGLLASAPERIAMADLLAASFTPALLALRP